MPSQVVMVTDNRGQRCFRSPPLPHHPGCLMDKKGKILIPGISEAVAPVTEEELELYDKIDFDLEEYTRDVGARTLLHGCKVPPICQAHTARSPEAPGEGAAGWTDPGIPRSRERQMLPMSAGNMRQAGSWELPNMSGTACDTPGTRPPAEGELLLVRTCWEMAHLPRCVSLLPREPGAKVEIDCTERLLTCWENQVWI